MNQGLTTKPTMHLGLRRTASETFASLKYPNYRLWFYGQLVSLVGTWMQATAQGYLIYELTHSPAYLGYVGFAAGIPAWLFTLYGGLIADRVPRRTLLVVTQTAMMTLAFLLAGLTFTGWVRPWHIIIFAFLLGIANAFDAPARQAFVLEMVSRQDLTNAIALNSTMFNSATAIGPAAAGLIYAWLGPAWCFTINAISFIAVIIALLMMRLEKPILLVRKSSLMLDIRAGLTFVTTDKAVRTIILNLGIISLFGLSFVTLMPAWAVEILGGDASTNGWMQSARGIGALVGALMTAAVGRLHVRGKLLTSGNIVMPVFLLVFAGLRALPLSLLALLGIGWGFMVYANNANSLVQTQVPDELRGRVMGIYTLTFFGLMPIGALLAGVAAENLGEPLTVIMGALVLLFAALLVLWRVPVLFNME
jgi:MFS family permease